jgi:hypothetical protein
LNKDLVWNTSHLFLCDFFKKATPLTWHLRLIEKVNCAKIFKGVFRDVAEKVVWRIY